MRALISECTPRVLVLDLSAVPNLEFTALRMLTDGEEKLREDGTMLWLVALNPDVLAVVQRSPLWERLGRERMFFTLEQAVERYQRESGGTRSGTEEDLWRKDGSLGSRPLPIPSGSSKRPPESERRNSWGTTRKRKRE